MQLLLRHMNVQMLDVFCSQETINLLLTPADHLFQSRSDMQVHIDRFDAVKVQYELCRKTRRHHIWQTPQSFA